MRGLKEGAEDICSVFADKGLEWQHTAELDALLSGELSAGEDAKTGATVGKESAGAFGAKMKRAFLTVRRASSRTRCCVRSESTLGPRTRRAQRTSGRGALEVRPAALSTRRHLCKPHCHT